MSAAPTWEGMGKYSRSLAGESRINNFPNRPRHSGAFMSSEPLNPFASPKADTSVVLSPADEELWPLAATTVAEVTPVSLPHAGRVRNPLYRFFVGLASGILRTVLVLALIFGVSRAFGGWMLAIVALSILLGLADFFLRPILFYRWWEARTRWWFEGRRECFFAARDPQAYFVALTKLERPNFTSFRLSNSRLPIHDMGLLKLDHTRGEVLLETDRRRYRIPRTSLLRCRVTHTAASWKKIPVIQLAYQTEGSPEELELLLAQTTPHEVLRCRRQTEALAVRILELVPLADPQEAVIVADVKP